MIVWLVADDVVADEAVPALEVDDLGDKLVDLDLLYVDVYDKELQDTFSLDVLDKVLLAFEQLRSNVLGVGDRKVVGLDVDQWFD